jgi:hypothetical protein
VSQTSEIEVRHPYVNEVPMDLLVGFESFRIDPEWVWVLVVDGKIKAQMLCANTHGVLTIMRISSLPDAPNGWALTLCRRVFKDCREQGLIAFMAFLSDGKKAERRLMRITERLGGFLVPVTGAWAAGSLVTRY